MAVNKVKITNDIELKDRLVAINRVTKVTKGGRTFTFAAIVVVGNEDGVIGWGLGKAGEVTAAIAKGVESAKKNLVRVPVLKGTIPHEVEVRFGGAQVFLKPASTGTGVVAAIACVVNPEIFVLGGGVSKAGEILCEYVSKYYKKYVFHGCRDAKFALATLGNDAGIYGAAKLVLE